MLPVLQIDKMRLINIPCDLKEYLSAVRFKGIGRKGVAIAEDFLRPVYAEPNGRQADPTFAQRIDDTGLNQIAKSEKLAILIRIVLGLPERRLRHNPFAMVIVVAIKPTAQRNPLHPQKFCGFGNAICPNAEFH